MVPLWENTDKKNQVHHLPRLVFIIPLLQESAIVLSSKPTKEVPPHGLLYIGQREMAVVAPEDGNAIV